MNARYRIYFLVVIFFPIYSFGQKEIDERDEINYEIYVKLKKDKFFGTDASIGVDFNKELPFLEGKRKSISEAKRPFASSKGNSDLVRVYKLRFSKHEERDEAIMLLKNHPSVELVEKVPERRINQLPTDPLLMQQWALNKIKAKEAWQVSSPSTTSIVAVVDNAIQITHPDLIPNLVQGYDVADNDNDPSPINSNFSHGTHVAGIIAAATNNQLGIASASNNKVKVMPIKATPDTGDSQIIYSGFEGILWAANNGAKIISISWGGVGYSQVEQDIISSLYSQGILIIAAAGNANSETKEYPASYDFVVSVASTDQNDVKSNFSCFNSAVDIAAPGTSILSTFPTDNYHTLSGTSMATPLVASVAGYLKAMQPSLSPSELETLLKRTAKNIISQNPNYFGKLGAGRLDMLSAVDCQASGLSQIQIQSVRPTFFCEGDSTVLKATQFSGASYSWYKNGEPIDNSNIFEYAAKMGGNYHVVASLGSCTYASSPILVRINTTASPMPTGSPITSEAFYCQPAQPLFVNAPSCNLDGPKIFSYVGATIGYDGDRQSDPSPTVDVQGVAGTVVNMSVSVTWEKKDGYTYTSCGDASGTGIPFYEEVSFKLRSPTGKVITLLAPSTYAKGTSSTGQITTVFSDGGQPIVAGSLPASGIFKPVESLSGFTDEIAIGEWTLLPSDNGFIDPLCVSGFNITLTTSASTATPTITWYNSTSATIPLHSGNYFTPSTDKVGALTYYARSTCDAACPSNPFLINFRVKSVPHITAYPVTGLSGTIINDTELLRKYKVISTADGLKLSLNSQAGTTTTASEITMLPLETPITDCEAKTYLLVASGCNGLVVWNTGTIGENEVAVSDISKTYIASCLQTWNCTPLGAATFQILKGSTTNLLSLSDSNYLAPSSSRNFIAKKITSSQKIPMAANVQYKASDSVMLLPGFQTSPNSVFTAEIGGCISSN